MVKETKKAEVKPEVLVSSEFNANQDLKLHYKNDNGVLVSCPSTDNNAKMVLVSKGEAIPEIFVSKLINHNRNFIDNLKMVAGVPQLSKEQIEKYSANLEVEKSVEPKYSQYSMENLHKKAKELGDSKFKEWAESTFGKEAIDKRKSVSNIVNAIRSFVG